LRPRRQGLHTHAPRAWWRDDNACYFNSPASNHGVVFRAAGNTDDAFGFLTSEHQTDGLRPYLVIEYRP